MNDTPQPIGNILSEEEVRRRFPNVAAGPNSQDATREAEELEYQRQQDRNDRRERMTAFLRQVGPRHRQCTLDNYAIDEPGQEAVIAVLRDYVSNARERIAAGRGIVLFGPSGTGKDHLLVGVGRELVQRFRVPVVWGHGLAVQSEFRDAITSDTLERVLVAKYVAPQVWILSDPLPPRGALSDYQATTLLRILDERYRQLRPTLVSINVASGQEADERLGAAAVDRLKDGAVTAFCRWSSHRRGNQILLA